MKNRNRKRRRRLTHGARSGGHDSPSGHHGGGSCRDHRALPAQRVQRAQRALIRRVDVDVVGEGDSGAPGVGRLPRIGEPVANAVNGQDVARMRGVRLELAADVLDMGVDRSLV